MSHILKNITLLFTERKKPIFPLKLSLLSLSKGGLFGYVYRGYFDLLCNGCIILYMKKIGEPYFFLLMFYIDFSQ